MIVNPPSDRHSTCILPDFSLTRIESPTELIEKDLVSANLAASSPLYSFLLYTTRRSVLSIISSSWILRTRNLLHTWPSQSFLSEHNLEKKYLKCFFFNLLTFDKCFILWTVSKLNKAYFVYKCQVVKCFKRRSLQGTDLSCRLNGWSYFRIRNTFILRAATVQDRSISFISRRGIHRWTELRICPG